MQKPNSTETIAARTHKCLGRAEGPGAPLDIRPNIHGIGVAHPSVLAHALPFDCFTATILSPRQGRLAEREPRYPPDVCKYVHMHAPCAADSGLPRGERSWMKMARIWPRMPVTSAPRTCPRGPERTVNNNRNPTPKNLQ